MNAKPRTLSRLAFWHLLLFTRHFASHLILVKATFAFKCACVCICILWQEVRQPRDAGNGCARINCTRLWNESNARWWGQTMLNCIRSSRAPLGLRSNNLNAYTVNIFDVIRFYADSSANAFERLFSYKTKSPINFSLFREKEKIMIIKLKTANLLSESKRKDLQWNMD